MPNVTKNWPLGNGSHRISGNFGALVPSLQEAKDNGFDDILWLLDGYIKEMTFSNFYVLMKTRFGYHELLIPPDDGCIYNSTFRKTLLEMQSEIITDYA